LGNDTLSGGDGNDYYIVDSALDVVLEGETSLGGNTGVPPKFDPIVMRGFVGVSGCFRCLAERRP
jgi:Ca2+-binding RTX toxin-like protein